MYKAYGGIATDDRGEVFYHDSLDEKLFKSIRSLYGIKTCMGIKSATPESVVDKVFDFTDFWENFSSDVSDMIIPKINFINDLVQKLKQAAEGVVLFLSKFPQRADEIMEEKVWYRLRKLTIQLYQNIRSSFSKKRFVKMLSVAHQLARKYLNATDNVISFLRDEKETFYKISGDRESMGMANIAKMIESLKKSAESGNSDDISDSFLNMEKYMDDYDRMLSNVYRYASGQMEIVKTIESLNKILFKELFGDLDTAIGYRKVLIKGYFDIVEYDVSRKDIGQAKLILSPSVMMQYVDWGMFCTKNLKDLQHELHAIIGGYSESDIDDFVKELEAIG